MEDFVIGVDGGMSKTAAVVLDKRGRILGRGAGGPANPHVVGWEGAERAIEESIARATQAAHVEPYQAKAMMWAVGGVERPGERARILAFAARRWPHVPVLVENDALAALVGGLGKAQGIVLIAGTGMIAYGVDERGQRARAGGRGYHLDRGNGYALGLAGLRAVLWAHDGMDMATALEERLLSHLGLSGVDALIEWLYGADRSVGEIAALAPLVIAAAEEGDTAAVDIVAQAADALAMSVRSVAGRLAFSREVPVTFWGSLLTENTFYRDVVDQAIRTQVPGARIYLPLGDAAWGAALLAWEHVGVEIPRSAPRPLQGERGPWASEEQNVLSRNLDRRSVAQIVGLMHVEDRRAVNAVRAVLPDVARAVEATAERMRRGGRLIYVGAGTSGRLGVLDASECPPTFGIAPDRVVAVIAGGDAALRTALEGAEDSAEDGARAVADLQVGPLDTVVGITASGRTPYVVGALEEAQRRGALTIGVVCNLPAVVADLAHIAIAPRVGPEVLTGSTRLKAGTAQKLVLNMLSTAVMVRLGKVYDNLMVDVQPANQKLRSRAQRILESLAHITEEEAKAVLERSGWDVKVALVSALAGCSPEEARERLAKAQGFVRYAVSRNVEEKSQ